MRSYKIAYSLRDGHIASGEGSHAALIGSAREWDHYLRAIVFPDQHAVYFRLYAPKYDGMGAPTSDDLDTSFEAADKAHRALVRCKMVGRKWRAVYWDQGAAARLHLDVRL